VGEAPWQIGLCLKYPNGGITYPFCGGTVVSRYHVITAAHCTDPIVTDATYSVLYGTTSNQPDTSRMIDVQTVTNHPKYVGSTRTYDNDIAILLLVAPVPFSSSVGPACLPNPDTDYAGRDALLSGWGATAWKGDGSDTLLKVVMPVATHDYCKSYWRTGYSSAPRVCTTDLEGKDTCQGDSGGPLVVQNQGSFDLVGIVSSGYKCAAGMPGLYTEVAAFLPWINEIMCQQSEDYFCSK